MKRGLQRIEIGVFVFSLLCYTAVFATVGSVNLGSEASDLRIIAVLSMVCSAAILVVPTAQPFWVFNAARVLLLLMAVNTLAFRDPVVEFLLLIPFLAESGLYATPALALGGGLATLGLVAVLGFGSPSFEWGPGLARAAVLVLGGGGLLIGGVLLTSYRNQVVRERLLVERLGRDVDQLIEANRAFQDYADTIESVTEEAERHRITRELHDVIGYSLTNVIMMMNAGKVLCRDQPEKLEELFLQARAHADEALQESRKILYTLRAIQPTPRKGMNAIHHLAQSFQAATDIQVDVAYGNLPQSLGHDIDTALFRLVQEGMTNALRHGEAKHVKIRFWRRDNEVQVQVWDNGKGAQAVIEGLGLSGMRERFSDLGGRVEADAVPDGFQVTATIPLAEEGPLES